jgi:hypothetical protein
MTEYQTKGAAMPPTKTCSSHCRACGRHFSGDTAFDRHKAGAFEGDGQRQNTRRCRDPEQDEWYEAVEGECRNADPDHPSTGIAIWRQSGAAERTKGLRREKAAVA